jgi:opacity protein-like surface antigen
MLAGLTYEPTVSDRYYLGYRMTPDSTGGDMQGYDPFERDYGTLVAGSNRKLSDQLSIYTEENYDFLGRQQSLTHAWGIDYAPDQAWKLGASAEAGQIHDDINGDFERIAVSGSASHSLEGRSASLRLEARFEDAIDGEADDRNTFLATANWAVKVDPDWRFLAKVDAAVSQSDESVILDGDYVEASAGFAYRPVENDRLNALLKYTYLQDLPGPSQVNANDQLAGPRQRSHVVSADFIYALNERVSLGAKYGVRLGEVEWNRGEGDFAPSTAQLAVARIDVRIVHDWDFMAEGRALWMSELEQVNYGALAGVYRHIGDNLKVGVGYNFGRFSDDLTDLTLDDGGVFLNGIGQF